MNVHEFEQGFLAFHQSTDYSTEKSESWQMGWMGAKYGYFNDWFNNLLEERFNRQNDPVRVKFDGFVKLQYITTPEQVAVAIDISTVQALSLLMDDFRNGYNDAIIRTYHGDNHHIHTYNVGRVFTETNYCQHCNRAVSVEEIENRPTFYYGYDPDDAKEP